MFTEVCGEKQKKKTTVYDDSCTSARSPSLFSPLSGPIGLVCLIVAKAMGASQVIITGKHPLLLELLHG